MKNNILKKIIFSLLLFINYSVFSQVKKTISDLDKVALEKIIVEKYYSYDSKDIMDTIGGVLPKGCLVYRIYVDMKPNYTLQAVYGVSEHPLFIKTTTLFFNNTNQGQGSGDYVNDSKIVNNTAAFDSWITMGAATKAHYGILRAEDKDGSILKINSLNSSDGLIASTIKPVTYFGMIPNFFNTYNSSNMFFTDNGSWAIFGGIKGPTEENRVLIAQLATEGELSFELNIQMGTPTGASINYVAKNPQGAEIKYDGLIQNKIEIK
jgi:hypothetical protein